MIEGRVRVYGAYRHVDQYFSYIMRSVLLAEKTRIPGENHCFVAGHWQTSSHIFSLGA